jgi:hypothetical protein
MRSTTDSISAAMSAAHKPQEEQRRQVSQLQNDFSNWLRSADGKMRGVEGGSALVRSAVLSHLALEALPPVTVTVED